MQDQLKNILHALAELEKRVAALENGKPIQPFGAGDPTPEEPKPRP